MEMNISFFVILFNLVFLFLSEKSIFQRLFYFLLGKKRNNALSKLYKNKDFLFNNVLKKLEYLSKKLTKEDNEFIKFINEKNIKFNVDIFYLLFLENYIESNDKTTLENNRDNLFKIIDRLSEEHYQKEILDLYLTKININLNNSYKSSVLNKVSEELNNKNIISSNTSKTIKNI